MNEETKGTLELSLVITDPTITSYLKRFPEGDEREDKAIEALKVGVIAIQSASPSLDTSVVKERFTCMENELSSSIDRMKVDVQSYLKQYFDCENGSVKLFLDKQLGDSSPFAKKLDPSNKESILSQVEEKVNELVKAQVDVIVKEFSLDKDDSSLSKLKKVLQEQVELLKKDVTEFQAKLIAGLKWDEKLKETVDKGAQKGKVFEQLLYEHVASLSKAAGDMTEFTGDTIGAIPRSKKGDHVITIGDEHAAAGEKIVIEAKEDRSYTFAKSFAELKEAKENRKAAIGIFAYASGYEPPEVVDFRKEGNDFFVVVDRADLENNKPLGYLDMSIKVARSILTMQEKEASKEGFDVERAKELISDIYRELQNISDCKSKSVTILNHASDIGKKLDEHFKNQQNNLQHLIELLEIELDLSQIPLKKAKK
jgi:hypothetical protein